MLEKFTMVLGVIVINNGQHNYLSKLTVLKGMTVVSFLSQLKTFAKLLINSQFACMEKKNSWKINKLSKSPDPKSRQDTSLKKPNKSL